MSRRKKIFIVLLFVIGALTIKNAEVSASNKYKIVDGDSLERGNIRIRLIDIDAPEFFQDCYDENNEPYKCGKLALNELKKLINDKTICKTVSIDRYKRKLSECFDENNESINKKMVHNGWAVAYGNKFIEDENIAKKQKRGIWKGRFMRPELYRALHKN